MAHIIPLVGGKLKLILKTLLRIFACLPIFDNYQQSFQGKARLRLLMGDVESLGLSRVSSFSCKCYYSIANHRPKKQME